MRSLIYGCLLVGIIALTILGCSGSSSPLTPDNLDLNTPHAAAIQAALDGVDIQNTSLQSVKIAGNELLPWGLIDIMLSADGTFPLDITLADPGHDISVSIDGATLIADGNPVDSYSGPADGNLELTEVSERITIHIEIPGDYRQTRDITIRTAPSVHWPTIRNLGVETMTDPETALDFDVAVREILIGADHGTPVEVVEALVGSLDCELLRALPNIDAYRLRIPVGADYSRYFRLFESSSIIRYAEFNCIYYPAIVPNDTYEGQEYGNDLMQLYDAWDIHTGTDATIVAVVDSGMMRDHPDLYQNAIEGEDFIDPPGDGLGGETPGNGIDENNDGYADGNVGHGTHCSGIVGAVGNNSEGVSGHTWATHILPCRVFPIDGDSGAMDTDIADAIMWASDQGAIGISMSFGSYYGSGTEQAAINYAWNNGSVLVAAGGNGGTSASHYPSAFPNVIGVGATDQNDKKASFSNYGSYIDCCAPGYQIPSSIFYEHGGDPWSVPENQRYALYSGTSMACPQVSGLVGLVKSYFPSYSNAEVADQVVFTADDIDSLNPTYAGKLGTGRINDFNALTMPLAPDFEVVTLWNNDDNPLYSMGNRDGFLNPGEIIEFRPTLKNTGTRSAPNCMLTLEGGDGHITRLFDMIDLGFFDRGETMIPEVPIIFKIDPALTSDTPLDMTLHFEYDNGDPIDVSMPITVRTDLGIVDTISCFGEGLLEDEIRKGISGVPALSFTIEGDLNYGTLDELIIHQSGTAPSASFTPIELWLDADGDGVFIPDRDERIAYRTYDHPGYRGSFDDINDPESGFDTGVGYEDFPPVVFDSEGEAHFYECVVPTAPSVPRTMFVVIGILPTAQTGDTVQIGILSTDDVIVRIPDQVSPVDFPIQTDEVPIIGTWLDPDKLTNNGVGLDAMYSWRAETAVCPVSGNVYVVFDSNRLDDFDVFIKRSIDQAETFGEAIRLDPSEAREFYPDVQVDQDGTVHVVYYSTIISGNNREIYYVRSTDQGQSWETPLRLTNATRDSRIPKLAVGPDNSLNVAWHDDRTATDDYNIYFKRSEDGGDTWSADLMVADTYRASEDVAIIVGGDGVIHITWEEFSNYYSANTRYSRSADNGLTWSSPVNITTGAYANHGWHSDVGADNSGNVYVVFHYVSFSIPAEISCSVSNNSGVNWNNPFNITDNNVADSRPAIYVSPDGSYIDIVYRNLAVDSWNIYHVYSDDGLSTWSDPYQISQSTGGDANEPVVVRASNLNIFAFWEDVINSKGSYEIFWNRYLY